MTSSKFLTVRSIVSLFSFLIFLAIALNHFSKNPGFTVDKISSNFSYEKNWEITDLPDVGSLNEIFSQAFTYVGNGAQCYAFASEDKKHILKLFKMNHLTSRKYLNWINSYRIKNEKRDQNLQETFSSFKTAYEDFKEASGLVFIHLNRTNQMNKKLTLIDKEKNKWVIDLDSTVFVLQERADLIYSHLVPLLEAGLYKQAQSSIDAVLSIIAARCKKGFTDSDEGVSHNYGFVGDLAIQIDVGRLIKNTGPQDLSQVQKTEKKIYSWLETYHPDLFAKFQEAKKA